MKIEGLIKEQKLTTPNFLDRFLFWEKSPKIPLEQDFFLAFSKSLIYLCFFFFQKMVNSNALYYSMKVVSLGKIWIFSYCPKCSQLIRLSDSLIISISGRSH